MPCVAELISLPNLGNTTHIEKLTAKAIIMFNFQNLMYYFMTANKHKSLFKKEENAHFIEFNSMKVFSKIVRIFRFISVPHFFSHFCLSKRISGLIDFVSNFGLKVKIKNAKKEKIGSFDLKMLRARKIQSGAVLGTSHTSRVSSKIFRANFLI